MADVAKAREQRARLLDIARKTRSDILRVPRLLEQQVGDDVVKCLRRERQRRREVVERRHAVRK